MNNKGNKKYPVISEKVYMMLVNRNESYNGFVEYADGIVSFVLTEVVVQAVALGTNHNRLTNYQMHPIHKYHEKVIAVNDAIPANNRSPLANRLAYAQSMADGTVKTTFRIEVDKRLQQLKAESFYILLRNEASKAEIDNKIASYQMLIDHLASNKPFGLGLIPDELQQTDAGRRYIAYFEITSGQRMSYITQGSTDEERRQRKYQKDLANWKNADPVASQIVEGMGYGVMGASFFVGAGEASMVVSGVRSAFTVSTEMSLLKGGMSWGAQALINGPREVNYISVVGDALFKVPLTGSTIGGVFEYRPFTRKPENIIRVAGYNKSLEQTTIDVGSAYLFGKAGGYTWGKLNPILNNNSERYIMFISTQTWNYIGTYGVSKKYGTDQ